MDPNANLKEQLDLARDIIRQADSENPDDYVLAGQAMELAERVQALNDWINKGGGLPDAWKGK